MEEEKKEEEKKEEESFHIGEIDSFLCQQSCGKLKKEISKMGEN